MREVFLPEGHPETGPFKGWKIDDKRLQFLVVNQVRLLFANSWIGQWLVYFMWFSPDPFSIFPVFPLLGNFPDVYLRIEVGGKRLSVVSGIAVYDIQVLNLIKMMFRSIGSVNA